MKILRGIAFFFTTQLIYLLLPMIGWGILDITGYFSSGPRAGHAAVCLALGIAVGIQAAENPEGIRGRSGEKGKLVGRQRLVRIAVTGLMYVAFIFFPFADRRDIGTLHLPLALRWVGTGLFTTGVAFVFWSGVSLGKYYSADVTIQENHRLVKDGLYRFIRHPRYLGALLMAGGFVLLYHSWIGLLWLFPFISILLFRIRDEETLMEREFGEEWREYRRNTWRLLPFIY